MVDRLRHYEPYWYPILGFTIAAAVLFVAHLQTGYVPNRVALSIDAINLDIFWYGILIISGVVLGAYVAGRLAAERGRAAFRQAVPVAVRERPLAKIDLPPNVVERLAGDVTTLGALLYERGYDPARLGLKRAERLALDAALTEQPDVETRWLLDAPWRQWNPDHVWNGIIWCLLLALVGARLYHVLTPSPSMAEVGIFSPADYFRNPFELINFRRGGLGIYGGIVGGLLGLYLYTRRHRLDSLAWADLAAVGLPLGQYIGRWGNFFNQELYGRPTDLPWAIYIDPTNRLPGFVDQVRFHPAFLYESLWNLFTFLGLLTLARRRPAWLQTGDLTGLYLILYAIGRILLETVRLDSRTLVLGPLALDISIATFVSGIVAVAMAGWLFQRHRRVA